MTWIEWIVFIAAAIVGILVMGAAIEEIVKFLGKDISEDDDYAE